MKNMKKFLSLFLTVLMIMASASMIFVSAEEDTENGNLTVPTGAVLHLDASDAASLTVDANGYVSQWKTKDGTYAVSQTTSEKQPKLVEYDGYKALYFDGTDGLTNLTATALKDALSNNTAVTAIAVSRCAQSAFATGFSPDVYGILYVQQGDGWGKFTLNAHQDYAGFMYAPGRNHQVKYARTELGLTSTIGVKNGATETLYVDGTLVNTVTNCPAQTVKVSDDLYIGTNAASQGFVGDIAEIMIFDRALSDTEIASVNAYIKQKYFNVSTPVVNEEFDILADTHKVALSTNTIGADIYYTTDGSEPDGDTAIKYTAPIEITDTVALKAIAVKSGWNNSSKLEANISKNNVISNAVLHLDASDAASLTVDANGYVSQWKTKDGTYAVSQATAANQPKLVEYDGYKALYFDGTDGLTNLTATALQKALSNNTAVTAIAVSRCAQSTFAKPFGGGDVYGILYVQQAGDWGKFTLNAHQDYAGFTFAPGKTPTDKYTAYARNEIGLTSTMGVKNGTTESLYVDGTLVKTSTRCSEKTINVSDDLYIGTNKANECFVGDIAEVMVFDRALSDAEIAAVNAYINQKYFNVSEPVVNEEFDVLTGEHKVTLSTNTIGADIYYTIDGSEPDGATAIKYTAPIEITEAITVKAIAVKNGWNSSDKIEKNICKHNVTTADAKAPTCTEKGSTEGKYCSVCNEVFVAQEEIAANGHTWKAATCTVAKTCSVCGATEGDALGHDWAAADCDTPKTCKTCGATDGDALGHTWKAATCTAPKTCSVCGATEGEALGHTPKAAVKENVVDATCTTAGSYDEVVYCSVCNEKLSSEHKTVEKLAHTEEVVPGKDATCTEKGLTEGKKCTVCGVTTVEQEEIAALGHTEEVVAGKAATCTEKGLTEGKKCTVCGVTTVEQEEIAALGHTEEVVAGKAATCTEKGLTDGKKCTVCGVTTVEQEEIAALGHTEETIPGQTETCYVPGSTEGKKCSVCGEILVAPEVIPAHHTPKEAVSENIVNATCTAAGSYDEVVYCEICNEELNRTHKDVEKLAHTEEVIPAVDATCTEIGLTEGKKCSVCGETLVAQEEIAALGHTEEVVAGKAATCTESGLTEGKKCSVCGETLVAQEVIEALGHTEEVVEGYDATCTEAGLTEGKKCTVCGETLVAQEEIAALGHTEEVVAGKAATCTEKGLTDGKKCSVCGEITVEQEVIEALGHTEATVPAIPATCTEAGLTDGKICSVCGETLVAQEEIAALGHNDADADNVCDLCGLVLKVEEEEEEDKSVVETIRDNISSVVEKATETATEAVKNAVESARETADRVSEAATEIVKNITASFESIKANVTEFFDGLKAKLEEVFDF